jgi:hypothetical protein
MKMTVRDCLELPAFKKAVIISGKQGLDNRVSAVSFLESGYSPDQIQSNRYRSDEMILSAFFPDGSNEETQLQLIRSIAKEGGAALVLMPPAAISEGWTQHVINLSNDLKLPIISIQDDHELAYSVGIADNGAPSEFVISTTEGSSAKVLNITSSPLYPILIFCPSVIM